MKNEIIKTLTRDFESFSNQTQDGVEFWFARDIQHLLEYTDWRNFIKVISKAKTACETANHAIIDHFVDVNKMVQIGSGTQREIDDIMLTRFACYLIAQNGDPKKEAIAFAQNYFAVQTRKFELVEQRIKDWEQLQARQKFSISEKELSGLIFERTGNEKDFATEITIFNIKDKDNKTGQQISWEHIRNNKGVRKLLLERGIKSEELPADENVKVLERRVQSEDKKFLMNPDKLSLDD
ncbi:MAG TPA: DNA damage-inducible protein D [Bacteroidales bacterium]|nr:DNA damage-inducible protein D [Bacteroidales bacterium]